MQVPQAMDSKAAGAQQAPHAAYPQTGFAPYGYPSTHVPPQDLHVPSNATDTDLMVKGFEFNTESIRRGFIRKVYSILSVNQLLLNIRMKPQSSFKSILLQIQFYFLGTINLHIFRCDGICSSSRNKRICLSKFLAVYS